jgi:membrane associated rhomboid family serine protease
MTIILVALTAIISLAAFNNGELFSKLQLNPYQVVHRKEYYRIISHGFIHADWMHLIVNMFILYQFGSITEKTFVELSDSGLMHYPRIWFTFLYLAAIVVSSLVTIYKHKDNIMYNCIGASGAVSAILFCSIFFSPMSKMGIIFIPIAIPGIILGVLYLIYSQYMSNKNIDNINHDAHFIGAVFGFLFPLFINYRWFFDIFVYQLLNR